MGTERQMHFGEARRLMREVEELTAIAERSTDPTLAKTAETMAANIRAQVRPFIRAANEKRA